MEKGSVDARMSGSPSYIVLLLEDEASAWPAVQKLLPSWARTEQGSSGASEIGLIGWVSATREETARLPALRAEHPGPLVAVVSELPGARGARISAARLEGAVLTGEIEQTLLPTLAAVAAGQCVVPRAIWGEGEESWMGVPASSTRVITTLPAST